MIEQHFSIRVKAMANYDYECKNCGHKTIETHGMKEDPEIPCIRCGHIMVKLFSPGSPAIYKCGGFYCKPEADKKGESKKDE